MAPPSPDEIRRTLDRLSTAAIGDAQRLFSVADPRVAVVDQLLPIVSHYADGAAALGADYYDEVRDAATPPRAFRPFRANPVGDVDAERIRRGALWSVEPLYQDELDLGLAQSRLASVVQPAVVDPFRTTIVEAQKLDPDAVGYKRSASNGCKFCRMLAGRGAVYRNNAHFASHPHCNCTATPVFADGNEGPEASVIQYTASQRRRTPAQQAQVREHLRGMPDLPRPANPNQPALGDKVRAPRRARYTDDQLADTATEFGVSVDELQAARSEVLALRRRVYDEAASAAADSFRVLDAADALSIRPPRRGISAGEYDWMERISPEERSRLGKRWMTARDTNLVDEVAERLRDVVPGISNLSDDEVIRTVWLHHNRRIEASGAIRRGKLPRARAYSGEIDAGSFAPIVESEGYDVVALFADDLDAAGHIAQVRHGAFADEAAHLLDSYATGLGPAPWEMSFQAWEAEVRTLENAVGGLGTEPLEAFTDDQARRRLRELLPPELDAPGFSYEDAYSSVITTARLAEYRVPAHAVIEWEV